MLGDPASARRAASAALVPARRVRAAADVGASVHNGRVSMQPALDLWEVEVRPHHERIVARSADRVAWMRARSQGVTATDAARLSSIASARGVAMDKLLGRGFGGNAYTEHGRVREPEIAKWVLAEHGIEANDALFHAATEKSHLATPDGVSLATSGSLQLCEIKTTEKLWKSIPRSYLRQVWWQQYVLGAERTLVVWEQHSEFVPLGSEPKCKWVDRDDHQIAVLVARARLVLDYMRPGGLKH
jgi:hypothetical protein